VRRCSAVQRCSWRHCCDETKCQLKLHLCNAEY
jgi:hypothetical protein